MAHGGDVLVLDEATSSIDTETERLIQRGIHNLLQGRTSIVIAHRLSTIRDVDRIYVLEGGRPGRVWGPRGAPRPRGALRTGLHQLQVEAEAEGLGPDGLPLAQAL